MLTGIVVISSIGFLVCVYGFFIKRNLKLDQDYKAVCDLSDKVSCTKTFLSPWGKLFGISTIYIGMVFYAAMILFGLSGQVQLVFLGAVSACIASLFLAYILYAKIKTFCLVCVTTYVVNVILLVLAYRNL